MELYKGEVIIRATLILVTYAALESFAEDFDNQIQATTVTPFLVVEDNTIETHQRVACGTIANATHILVRNPHHPGPTYVKSICELVIEQVDPSIQRLQISFKQLELYRPTMDGQCVHDRFAIYTDLNAAVTPILCGNQTGKTITLPFSSPKASLILSITTSDLDYDRSWVIEIEQEK